MDLDVGCGNIPRGDINVDLYKRDNPQIEQYRNVKVDPREIPQFILASGLFLPFQKDVFDVVFCYDVLEHTDQPHKMLKELLRVSKYRVEIQTPHRFGKWAKMPYHKSYFSIKWFFRNVPYPLESETTYWFPFRFLIAFPNIIRIRIFKRFPKRA